MAYDAAITIRQNEQVVVTGTLAAAAGDTFTVQTSPAATFSLYNDSGTVAAGFNGVAVTGYTAGAAAVVSVWYLFNSAGLAAGVYDAAISFAVKSTADGMVRDEIFDTQVAILAVTEISATFDLTTPIGQVRLYCGDADLASPIFSDAEIGQFLLDGGANTYLASALALETICSSKALLSAAVKLGTWGDDENAVFQNCGAQASRWRAHSVVALVANPPDQVFSTDSGAETVLGTTSPW